VVVEVSALGCTRVVAVAACVQVHHNGRRVGVGAVVQCQWVSYTVRLAAVCALCLGHERVAMWSLA
jgi:hypothetical protein